MCCKKKDLSDPGSNAALAVQSPRKNGWSWPLHPFQFIAWIFILYFGTVHFGILVPVMPTEWQMAGYITVGIFLGLHCVLHIWSLSVNPADDNVIRKWKGLEPKRYDRTMQAHVIENNRCYICDTDVCASAKHCRLCNKCVSGFDHHCRWLNSCIGDKNYKLFISCLVTALVGAILIIAVTLYVTVMFWVDPSVLHYAQQGILVTDVVPSVASDLPSVAPNISSNGTTPLPTTSSNDVTYKYYLFAEVPGAAFISVVITTMVLCLVAILLLGHLLCFHIYLMCNNLTTYDYIMRGREKAKKSSPESSQQNLKGNKVAPVAMISRDQGLHESMENGYVPENGYHHGSYDPNSSDEDTRQMQRQYEEVLMEDEALSPRLTARSSGRHRPTSADRERQDSDLQQPIMMKMPRQLPPIRPVANLVQETTQVAAAKKKKKPKRNNASKERKMEVAAIAANGTYTPRGYNINPTLPPITPPAPAPRNDVITPARSPSPYHSSSAESLQEIPLATIRGTGEQVQVIQAGASPNTSPHLPSQDPERRAHSKRRKAKPKERRPRPLDVPPLELTQTVTDGEYSLRSDVATGHSGRPLPPLHMATSNV
ncbi:PREDICTED: probable palmitoyltransferase ZDHHC1 isoform X1 [Branchiostoma belcheri]|uniref:Palmitoyltransferase n=1 Tax=Branchiostoma belcheri TaxID=7741 RepID=A0A6P5AA22_BRABE|nr:PREDICTED: probable palmitoyltransferase ZDHHC1 isoform X1 [Branchiostoma belcheri]